MLTILGLGMIMCFMYLIMSKRLSALVALTLIPIVFALLTYVLSLFVDNLAGFNIAELGNMMMEGIKKTSTYRRDAAFRHPLFCNYDRHGFIRPFREVDLKTG